MATRGHRRAWWQLWSGCGLVTASRAGALRHTGRPVGLLYLRHHELDLEPDGPLIPEYVLDGMLESCHLYPEHGGISSCSCVASRQQLPENLPVLLQGTSHCYWSMVIASRLLENICMALHMMQAQSGRTAVGMHNHEPEAMLVAEGAC